MPFKHKMQSHMQNTKLKIWEIKTDHIHYYMYVYAGLYINHLDALIVCFSECMCIFHMLGMYNTETVNEAFKWWCFSVN